MSAPSSRASDRGRIDPFLVMALVAEAGAIDRAHGDVIHLEVGQPSTGAPTAARQAAIRLLEDGDPLGYTDPTGTPELRASLVDHYHHRYGVTITDRQVAITSGASAGCVLAVLAAFDVGDRVGVIEPGYPCYRQILRALGCEPVAIRADGDHAFCPTPDALDAAGPLAGCIIASPSNPTGFTLNAEQQQDLQRWADERGTRLILDEIYHGITAHGDEPTSATTLAERAGTTTNAPIVVGSFSKYYCMTGWRLGWLILPDELIEPVERLSQNLYLAPPTLSQQMGVAALADGHRGPSELADNVERYNTNRQLLIDGLRRLGVTDIAPATGAFYVWARTDHWDDDSTSLCEDWLHTIRVAATPGEDFDRHNGRQWVRFSVAGPTDDIRTALERLASWDQQRADGLSYNRP